MIRKLLGTGGVRVALAVALSLSTVVVSGSTARASTEPPTVKTVTIGGVTVPLVPVNGYTPTGNGRLVKAGMELTAPTVATPDLPSTGPQPDSTSYGSCGESYLYMEDTGAYAQTYFSWGWVLYGRSAYYQSWQLWAWDGDGPPDPDGYWGSWYAHNGSYILNRSSWSMQVVSTTGPGLARGSAHMKAEGFTWACESYPDPSDAVYMAH